MEVHHHAVGKGVLLAHLDRRAVCHGALLKVVAVHPLAAIHAEEKKIACNLLLLYSLLKPGTPLSPIFPIVLASSAGGSGFPVIL